MTSQPLVQKKNSFFILDYIALSGSVALSFVYFLVILFFLFKTIRVTLS